MATIKHPVLQAGIIEGLSKVLGDSDQDKGLTGSEIGRLLCLANIEDINSTDTKWRRLFTAFAANQKKFQCSNQILTFIQYALAPGRNLNGKTKYDFLRKGVNEVLAFVGLEMAETGKFRTVEVATTISEAKGRANNLRSALTLRGTHDRIFLYCKEELLTENYFHAVLESAKSVFERIREISGLNSDGSKLIDETICSNSPMIIINSFSSESERNEQTGFANLLKGFCSMFRNPTAHTPKIKWEIKECDALDIMSLASYFHRRLDNCHRIR
jgi:uncharacterized protein (TIGR02391 family)